MRELRRKPTQLSQVEKAMRCRASPLRLLASRMGQLNAQFCLNGKSKVVIAGDGCAHGAPAPAMTIEYDAGDLTGWCGLPRLLCMWRGTVLVGAFFGPIFWLTMSSHIIFLLLDGRIETGMSPHPLPVLDWKIGTLCSSLLFFFVIFYGNAMYNRFYTFYGHVLGIGGRTMEWVSLCKVYSEAVEEPYRLAHAQDRGTMAGRPIQLAPRLVRSTFRWNALRFFLASAHLSFYAVYDQGIQENEWKMMQCAFPGGATPPQLPAHCFTGAPALSQDARYHEPGRGCHDQGVQGDEAVHPSLLGAGARQSVARAGRRLVPRHFARAHHTSLHWRDLGVSQPREPDHQHGQAAGPRRPRFTARLLALPQLRHQSPGLDAIGYFHLLNILMIVHPPDHPAATTARAHRLSQALPPAHPARRCSCSSSRTLSRRSPT